MKESARRIEFIDYIRGVAILSVFMYHCLAASYGFSTLSWDRLFRSFSVAPSFIALLPLHFGWIGVPIFFVVSGFCIHISFQQQGREWGSFFIRRFFRLYPAYLAALVLFTLLYDNKTRDAWLQFVSHVLLIHNYNSQTFFGLNAAFWTIAVEVQLYLLYPLLLFLVARFGWKSTLLFVGIFECFARGWKAAYETMQGLSGYDYPVLFNKLLPNFNYVDTPSMAFLNASPLAYWFSWSLGAFVADAFLKKQEIPLAKGRLWFWSFVVVIAYFVRPLYPFFFLFAAVLATIIVARYLSGTGPKLQLPDFWREQIRRVGLYSYSIYLLHQPLLEMLGRGLTRLFPEIYPFVKFLCCVGLWLAILPLAALWYRFIEAPGVALGKRIIQKISDKRKMPESSPAPSSSGNSN
jgi:peptidoglycan/LPS O-acetylase OafA/YrhL